MNMLLGQSLVEELFRGLESNDIQGDPVNLSLERTIAQQGQLSEKEKSRLRSEILGLGPLQVLLDDPTISEIIVDGHADILYERKGQLYKSEDSFLSHLTFDRILRHLLFIAGATVDTRFPYVDGTLPDGTRLHVIMPPAAAQTVITLRKHIVKEWSLTELGNQGTFNEKCLEILKTFVSQKKNILIAGPTNSGKTTLMRAILQEIDTKERVVVIEDTPELICNRKNTAFLKARHDVQGLVPDISLDHLLKNSLRMRPDRLLLGEVRGEEARTLLDSLSTGHSGSLCTIHASNAQQALQRLESLVLRATTQWPLQAIRQLIYDSIHVVVIMGKTETGQRKILQIARPAGLEDFGILLDDVDLTD